MMVTRRATFRLYPTKTVEATLFAQRKLHQYLYNACVYHRKTEYQKFGKSISYFDQQNCLPAFKEQWTDYKNIHSQALQATVKRVDFAFERFFKGLGKYPKFKAIRHFSGWTYPANSGWKVHTTGVNGYLDISKIGQIQMRGKAKTWGTPTSCTIVYRQRKWYASITLKCEVSRETSDGLIGLDFGCKTAVVAAIHEGEDAYTELKIENPRHLKKVEGKIKKANRQKKRKKAPNYKQKIKGSNRWKKAQKKVSKLQRKAANQRHDFIHKVAAQIVSSNSLVATEKLNLKNMTRKGKGKNGKRKKGLNKSILDVGMGMLRSAIEYKLTEAEGIFVEIPTSTVKPSQRCPNCGNLEKKTLSQRVHHCQKCEFTCDRDFASAIVCVKYVRGTLSGVRNSPQKRGSQASTDDPKVVKHCGGWKQVWEKKRQSTAKLSVEAKNPALNDSRAG
jgi:putative transposase